jgi:hypothetical protein
MTLLRLHYEWRISDSDWSGPSLSWGYGRTCLEVLLKVSILAWRLLRDRLPTKNNLVRRDIIQADAVKYVAGYGQDETAAHLFLHYDIFSSLWQHIRPWIDILGVDPHNISEHFIQFIHYTGHSKTRRSFLQLIWLLCVWLVWNERNNRLFNNIQTPIDHLLDKVKFILFWWLKANNTTFVYGSHRWWSDPMFCLGIEWPLYMRIFFWLSILGWSL